MNALLGGQLALDDFIFAHTKGQKKEIEIVKEDPSLGKYCLLPVFYNHAILHIFIPKLIN